MKSFREINPILTFTTCIFIIIGVMVLSYWVTEGCTPHKVVTPVIIQNHSVLNISQILTLTISPATNDNELYTNPNITARPANLATQVVNFWQYATRIALDLNAHNMSITNTKGKSMMPTIREGSTVLLEHKWTGELQVGDIITFHNEAVFPNNKIVIHRIIATETINNTTYYKTQGDNNKYNDDWIPSTNVEGLAIGIIY